MAGLSPDKYIGDIDSYAVGRFVITPPSRNGSSQLSEPPPMVELPEHATRDSSLLSSAYMRSASYSYNREMISSIQADENFRHHSFHGTDSQTASILAANKMECQMIDVIKKMRFSIDELERTMKRSLVPDDLKRSASDRYAYVCRDQSSFQKSPLWNLNCVPQNNKQVSEGCLKEMSRIVSLIQAVEKGFRAESTANLIFAKKAATAPGLNASFAKCPRSSLSTFGSGPQEQYEKASTLSVTSIMDLGISVEKPSTSCVPEAEVTTKIIQSADKSGELTECIGGNSGPKNETKEQALETGTVKNLESVQIALERYKRLAQSQAKEIANLKKSTAMPKQTAAETELKSMKVTSERDLRLSVMELKEQVSHYKTMTSIREKDLLAERRRLEEVQEYLIKKEVHWEQQQRELRSIICSLKSAIPNKDKTKHHPTSSNADYDYLLDIYPGVSYDDLSFASPMKPNFSQKRKLRFFGRKKKTEKE